MSQSQSKDASDAPSITQSLDACLCLFKDHQGLVRTTRPVTARRCDPRQCLLEKRLKADASVRTAYPACDRLGHRSEAIQFDFVWFEYDRGSHPAVFLGGLLQTFQEVRLASPVTGSEKAHAEVFVLGDACHLLYSTGKPL